AAAASGGVNPCPGDSRGDQRGTTATWCFPLPPQRSAQSQPDPANEGDQHRGRLAEAEIAAPAAQIGGQLFYCRLDANALGPSRDLSDSLLESVQRFWRDNALDVWTSREAEPEELPLLRSCHRA